MSDMKTAIMDAAQKRIQIGGFGGFSFREIAEDVGVKSSSVHYHFPTKDDLAAAVCRRWTETASDHFDAAFEKDSDPVRVWVKTLRDTIVADTRMCPCTVLGAAAQDLPPQVAAEVKRFFEMCLKKIVSQGLPAKAANELLSTLIGAMVMSNALGDTATYDRATNDLLRRRKAVAA
jgi:TetR/AcrR family transcriptional regulator, transcriptional repressor for nem operon